MLRKYIRIPKGNELQQVIAGFEQRQGFPQVGGVIDGTHIKILAPFTDASDYFSRYGCHTMVLQAVVDHKCCFTDICVGWPGKTHDARVFRNSQLYRKGMENNLFTSFTRTISDAEVPVVILGDPAYPLLPWLMKPYPGHSLSRQKNTFNFKQSSTRMAIEIAFGRLKGRWRCLLKRLDNRMVNIPTIVAACCVLHNFCELNKDTNDEFSVIDRPININEAEIGPDNEIRDAICKYLS